MPASLSRIFGVRQAEYNPWISERIRRHGKLGQGLTETIVFDLGSQSEHAAILGESARGSGFEYAHAECPGLFSLARARNLGFVKAKSEYLFFTDPDFISCSDAFSRIHAQLLDTDFFSRYSITNFPVVHFNKYATYEYERLNNPEARDKFLRNAVLAASYSSAGELHDIVVPYSNNVLISRGLYNLSGGYNENFTAHGSEDFEFIIRLAILLNIWPLPADLAKDVYKPTNPLIYTKKSLKYRGFRRLNEVIAFPASLSGTWFFHLHHPRNSKQVWYCNADADRRCLAQETGSYLNDNYKLLEFDWLPRDKRTLALLRTTEHWRDFLSLRGAGHKLTVMLMVGDMPFQAIEQKLASGSYTHVAVEAGDFATEGIRLGLDRLSKVHGVEIVEVPHAPRRETIFECDTYAALKLNCGSGMASSCAIGSLYFDYFVKACQRVLKKVLRYAHCKI